VSRDWGDKKIKKALGCCDQVVLFYSCAGKGKEREGEKKEEGGKKGAGGGEGGKKTRKDKMVGV